MSLGSFFPPELALESVKRQLKPGAVIKMIITGDDGKEHEKRFVIIEAGYDTLTCIINSQLTPFAQKTPSLLKCQATMACSEHAFMDHDSHIDCSRLRKYKFDDIVTQLKDRPEWILGLITKGLRDQIVSAIKCSTTMAPSEIENPIRALSEAEL